MRKSQYSMEFLIIFALLTMLFLIWLTIYSELSQDAFARRDMLAINDLGEAIESQIFLASSSRTGYKSTNLIIPNKAGHVEFDVLNTNYVFYLRTSKQDYIFHIPYMVGSLQKGQNILWNVNGIVVESDFNPYVSPQGLALLMHLDKDTGIGEDTDTFIDLSGLGNDGSCNLGGGTCPNSISTGKHNGAFSFDGNDDKITLSQQENFQFINAFTVSAWVNPSAENPSGNAIISKGAAWTLYRFGVQIIFSTNAPRTYTFPALIPIGEWRHIAIVVHADNSATLYLNGTAVMTFPGAGPLSTVLTDVTIGNDGALVWDGMIDDVRTYGRELNADEIQSLAEYPPFD